MTPTQGDAGSIFRRPWIRNLFAVFTLMVMLVISVWIYLAAVGVSNLQKVGEYRRLLGADTAVELWANSIERRDPQLFELHGHEILSSTPWVVEQLEEEVFSFTVNQLEEVLGSIRRSGGVQIPESVGFDTPFPRNFRLLRKVIGGCIPLQDESTEKVSSGAGKADLDRWMIGVELAESLSMHGLLIHEMLRIGSLKRVLGSGLDLISCDDAGALEDAAKILTRVESPSAALARALQMETLMVLELEERDRPFTTPLDYQYYLDRQIQLSLNPTSETLQELRVEDVPFYALASRLLIIRLNHVIEETENMDARLLALRCAFEATAAGLRGVDWIPPAGVELLQPASGGSATIHVTDGPAGTDILLPL